MLLKLSILLVNQIPVGIMHKSSGRAGFTKSTGNITGVEVSNLTAVSTRAEFLNIKLMCGLPIQSRSSRGNH